jgi:hypothetical protein
MNTPTDTEVKIHNFADNISRGARDCMTTNRVSDYFSVPGDQFQQAERSGEVVTALGRSIEWGQRPDTGAIVATAYEFILTIRLRTLRPADGQSGLIPSILSQHQQDAALILTLFDLNLSAANNNVTVRGPFGIENLPYYSVKFLNLQGCVPYTDWDFNQDVMEMTWNGAFSIEPGAWGS